jgi:hypothetical protein
LNIFGMRDTGKKTWWKSYKEIKTDPFSSQKPLMHTTSTSSQSPLPALLNCLPLVLSLFFVPYPYQTFISAPSIRFPGFSFPLSVSIKVVAASFTSAWFPSICPLQKTNNVCVRTQETCLCIYSKFKVLLCENEEKLKKIFPILNYDINT